ncbi:MAG: hypothetical protein WBA74_14880, partial [Cyclobacteriaceae bacterium]
MSFTRYFFTIAISLFGTWLIAEPNKQALKYIRENNFEKAGEQITRSLEKDSINPAGNYLAGLLHFQESYSGYNLDTAYTHTNIALLQWPQIEEKEQQKLIRIEISLDSIMQLQSAIEIAAYKEAIGMMDLEAFDRFFKKFDNDSLDAILIIKRDSLAYSNTKKINTWLAYRDYMEDYPASQLYSQAKKSYHSLIYSAKAKGRSLNEIERFLQEVPETPYRELLEKELLQLYTLSNATDSYHRFINKYPRSSARKIAIDVLYHLYKQQGRLDFPVRWLNDSLKSEAALENIGLIP